MKNESNRPLLGRVKKAKAIAVSIRGICGVNYEMQTVRMIDFIEGCPLKITHINANYFLDGNNYETKQ